MPDRSQLIFLTFLLCLPSTPVLAEDSAPNLNLPLPPINLPDNPALPPMVILSDGNKVLIEQLNIQVRYDAERKSLSCDALAGAWLVNYPWKLVVRPNSLSDRALAAEVCGEPATRVKNVYVRLAGKATGKISPRPLGILAPPDRPDIVVDSAATDKSGAGNGQPRVYRTVQQAVDAARPGDTVWVKSGVYRETVAIESAGTAGEPIRIQGEADPDGRLPVISGNDPAPADAFSPVAGQPNLYRAANWTDVASSLTLDGHVATERATAAELNSGEFSLNQSSRELAFPEFGDAIRSRELSTADWETVSVKPEDTFALPTNDGPVYLSAWLWIPPRSEKELWEPRNPVPLNGDVTIDGPYRAGRQSGTAVSSQLNQYRLWINGDLMPASGIPNGPTPNQAYGRKGDSWQRLPFQIGWNHVVALLAKNRKTDQPRQFDFQFPKGFDGVIAQPDAPSDLSQPPRESGDQAQGVRRWRVKKMPGDETDQDGAVYLQLVEGDSPDKHAIDLGRRGTLMNINAPHVHVQNLEFVHGAQGQQRAQVNINAHSVLLAHCRFREPEVRCLSVNMTNWDQDDPISIVRGNVLLSPGSLGMGGVGEKRTVTPDNQGGNIPGRGRMLVEFNTVRDNNRFGFKRQWESGGMKFFRLTRSVIRHNTIEGGDGPGLWLDWEHFNNRIEANFVRDVPMCAYGVEGSPGPNLICNNVAADVRDGNVWFKYAILGWSCARLWAVHNTVDSPHGLMFAEGPDRRAGNQWGTLPERGAAVVNNLIVGRPVSIHRGRLRFLRGNRFYGPRNGGLYPRSRWAYEGLTESVEGSSQIGDSPTVDLVNPKQRDFRLSPDHAKRLRNASVRTMTIATDSQHYDVLRDVRHDYFGLPRFADDPTLPGAYRYPFQSPDANGWIEIERNDGTLVRRIKSPQ